MHAHASHGSFWRLLLRGTAALCVTANTDALFDASIDADIASSSAASSASESITFRICDSGLRACATCEPRAWRV
jgi:hypothetical protein